MSTTDCAQPSERFSMVKITSLEVPPRIGGHIALDFVNTVNSWTQPVTRDDFSTFRQVARWFSDVGLISIEDARRLSELPGSATAIAHTEALAFRGLLLEIFGAAIDKVPVDSEHVEALSRVAIEAQGSCGLVARERTQNFEWRWVAPVAPRSLVLMMSLQAVALLEAGELDRLKRCPPPDGCGWLFLDDSRNRSRRWCCMELCGNRAKARRFSATRKGS